MPVIKQKNVEESLAGLKKDPAISKNDLANIVRAFAFHPNQERFLLQTNGYNEKLAETLMVFRKKLKEATDAGKAVDQLAGQMFLHYIINTSGPIKESDGDDPFDVFEAAGTYASLLCVDVSKDPEGYPLLHIDGRDIPCPQWETTPGMSAAWSLRNIGPVINRARYGRDDVIPSYAFGFDEKAASHTLENAMTLADFAHLAYFTPVYIEKQLREWGYDSFEWIENIESDTQAFVAGKDNHLVVCFRGTSSMKDALVDLNFIKTEAFGGVGKVHRGFQRALESVWPGVQAAVDKLKKGKKIFVCGHSLGAALALLATHRLALLGDNIAHTYVFGSPRVANTAFKDHYNDLLEHKTFLHINNKDIVTTVPLELLGFHHVGEKPRSFDNGHAITSAIAEIAASGEKDTPFEKLDAKTQEEIRQQMLDVQDSIRSSTKFLSTDPNQLSLGNYATQFEAGAADEHSMDQYLFKFACAILDGNWTKIDKARGK